MALPNGDLITTVFDPQMAYPVDRRMQVDTLNSRDSMSMFIRWEGMEVYVLENSKKYILQGGRSNEYWKENGTGTGTGGTTFVGHFPTEQDLPTTGRSPGDYAFVGSGDDFSAYYWDAISAAWVNTKDGFSIVSDKDGMPQFTASEDKSIRFEGGNGVGVSFDPGTNKVIVSLLDTPEYTHPTASIPNQSQTREVGEVISQLQMNISFIQNDAGTPSASDFGIYQSENNGNWVRLTSSQQNTLEDILVIPGTKRFRGSVDYPDGPVKNDNLGNPYPEGRIEAGTVHSNIVTITGRYLYFFGNTSSVPSDSGQTRDLPQSAFDNAPSIDLITGTSNTRFVVAIPATKSIVSVNDLTNLNADLTENYILTDPNFEVNDAAGNPVSYKLYVFSTSVPYNLSATHRIIIS